MVMTDPRRSEVQEVAADAAASEHRPEVGPQDETVPLRSAPSGAVPIRQICAGNRDRQARGSPRSGCSKTSRIA